MNDYTYCYIDDDGKKVFSWVRATDVSNAAYTIRKTFPNCVEIIYIIKMN
jgi:hypothetical protein